MMEMKKSGPHITGVAMITWLRGTADGEFSFYFMVGVDVRDCEDPRKSPAAPRPDDSAQ